MTERPNSDIDRLLAENDDLVRETIDPDVASEPSDQTEVEAPEAPDPDLEWARAQAPEHDPRSLTTEELRPEDEMIEYEPPDEPSPETAAGYTAADELAGETIDERLEQEEPDEPV
jgi:hypothetical protein